MKPANGNKKDNGLISVIIKKTILIMTKTTKINDFRFITIFPPKICNNYNVSYPYKFYPINLYKKQFIK